MRSARLAQACRPRGCSGLQFSNADGTYNVLGNATINGGDAGIDIDTGSSGTFTFGQAGVTTTNITHNSGIGDAFTLDGAPGTPSNATVTFNGSITANSGNAVNIDEHDAGTVTFQNGSINAAAASAGGIDVTNSNGGTINFNNATISLSTQTNAAVNLTSNAGATINFTPAAGGNGLDIVTSSGTGFNATGGGTVTVAGSSNTILAGTGTALNVVSTNIGAGDLKTSRASRRPVAQTASFSTIPVAVAA